jgi:hypothetical protein
LQAKTHGHHSYNKFIPENYLFNTLKNRIALFQGMMDGDGSVTIAENVLEYGSCSEQLLDDLIFLVQSFGGIARKSIRKEPWFTYKGERKIGRIFYRATLSLPNTINPFLLSRKANVYHPREKYPPAKAIVKIEEINKQLCQAIKINDLDLSYVTDNCVAMKC